MAGRPKLEDPKGVRITLRTTEETKALFMETKQQNSFESNGDFLQFLLEFFLQVRSNFERTHESGLRPGPSSPEEEEESMHMDYEIETDEDAKEDMEAAAGYLDMKTSHRKERNSFINDHSFLENCESAHDATEISVCMSDDELEDIVEPADPKEQIAEMVPMYESYCWGSSNLLNSCAVDTFMEIMFQSYIRRPESFENNASRHMIVLIQGYRKRIELNELESGKVAFWEWLRCKGANMFEVGNFISLTAIFEAFIGSLVSHQEGQLFKLQYEEHTRCDLYSQHSKTVTVTSNVVYVTKNKLKELGAIPDTETLCAKLFSTSKRKLRKDCQQSSLNSARNCCGKLIKSAFLKVHPKIIVLNVNDVAESKLGISKSVSIDFVHYGLVAVGFLKDDHYFCQILSSQSNYKQGWYLHDGLRNGGCATYLGEGPCILESTHVEVLVYEQVLPACTPKVSAGSQTKCSKEEEFCIVNASRAIVHIPSLEQLALAGNCQEKGCNKKIVSVKSNQRGVDLVLEMICSAYHTTKWFSSPWYYGRLSNNILCCAAIFLSGGSYSQFARFQGFLNLGKISAGQFYELQSLSILPAVHSAYTKLQHRLIGEVGSKEVIIASDTRSDTMGHCAMRGTCSFLDTETNVWLLMKCGDFREVDRKAPNLEKEKFREGLVYLKEQIKVKEVVTDASPQVICLMKNDPKLSSITHSLDVWHKAKKLTAKLTEAASKSINKSLEKWIAPIRNHFWYSCENCDGSVEKLKDLWLGVIHHVQGQHEWLGGRCNHELMIDADGDKEWLREDDPAMAAIREIVLDQNWLQSLAFYVNSRHTGSLESIHSLMLTYCPKRIGYMYDAYRGRMELAFLDYNHHKDRKTAVSKHGSKVLNRLYNRRTKTHFVVEVKERKRFTYIPDIMVNCMMQCAGKTRHDTSKSSELLCIESKFGKLGRSTVTPESTILIAQSQKSRISKGKR